MASFKICLLLFMAGMIITDAKSDKKLKAKKQRGDENVPFPDFSRAYYSEQYLARNVSYYLNFNDGYPTDVQHAYVALSYTFTKIAQTVIETKTNVNDVYDKNYLKYAELAQTFPSAARDYVDSVFEKIVQKHEFARQVISKFCAFGQDCEAKILWLINNVFNENQRRSIYLLLSVGLDLGGRNNYIFPKINEALSKKLSVPENLLKHSSSYKKYILVLVDVIEQANAVTLLGKEAVSNAIAVNVYE